MRETYIITQNKCLNQVSSKVAVPNDACNRIEQIERLQLLLAILLRFIKCAELCEERQSNSSASCTCTQRSFNYGVSVD
jgi:hypothetical protein